MGERSSCEGSAAAFHVAGSQGYHLRSRMVAIVAVMGPPTNAHLLSAELSRSRSLGQHLEMRYSTSGGAVFQILNHAVSCSRGMAVSGSGGDAENLPSGKATLTAVVGQAPCSARPVALTKLDRALCLEEGAIPTTVCPKDWAVTIPVLAKNFNTVFDS